MKITNYLAVGGVMLIGVVSLALAEDKAPDSKAKALPNAAASEKPSPSALSTNAAKKSKFPVIGYLQGRGQTIIIKAGAKGPVYTVKGADGKVLLEDLTAEQLRAQAPEVHEFIKSAVAVNTRNTADAALRLHQR